VCPTDTTPRIVDVTNSGDHTINANGGNAARDAMAPTVPTVLTRGPVTSYVGCLGGGNQAGPGYTAAYEEQPFNGMFHRNRAIKVSEVSDGLSNTIAIGERMSRHTEVTWLGAVPGSELVFSKFAKPYDPAKPSFNARPAITAVAVHVRSSGPSLTGSPGGFASPHVSGCQFANMDGSVRSIPESVDVPTFRALASRNGGEVLNVP
ncbi:MAG: DUF1559 domain-containing protein, partial [Fimbriiglobus sp.]